MAKQFNELREHLLRAGVAPRHVRRYLGELADHLADLTAEERSAGRSRAEAEAVAMARLGGVDELAQAMIGQRELQSWSVRAPWAAFGVAPLLVLAGAWYVALFMLWSGWNVFMPGSDTPFVRLQGVAILFFGIGRSIFFGAPVLVGWGVGLMAARQRLKAVWPVVSLVLIALIGGAGRVHVSRTPVAGGLGYIGMDFNVGPGSLRGVPAGVVHAPVILLLTAMPYAVWRVLLLRREVVR
jgi:hypothetical protein